MISTGALITSLVLGFMVMRSRKPADGRPVRRAQAGLRARRLRRGFPARLIDAGRGLPPRQPAPAQTAISGSMGMWNRAETIVRVWNPAIKSAVATVGQSLRAHVGPGQEQPQDREARSPRWLTR